MACVRRFLESEEFSDGATTLSYSDPFSDITGSCVTLECQQEMEVFRSNGEPTL